MQVPKCDLAADLDLMRSAALEAGALAMSFRSDGAKSWDKTPGHPVTEADLAVNALLLERLRDARPDYGWLSEETTDRADARSQARTWVIDPIDGTRAYMRPADPNWCIALALVEAGEAVAGVLYAPMHEELYAAHKGGGAFLNGEALSVSQRHEEARARIIIDEAVVKHPGWPKPWPDLILPKPKPNATLYRMALVAAGRWDATFALVRKSDWDLAAGAVLVAEAGGMVSTHIGTPLRFNRDIPAQRSMLTAGKPLYGLLLDRMKHLDLPDPNG